MIRSIAGLILAAGEGSRFGGPKALATSNGKGWLPLAAETLIDAGIGRIAIVIGSGADAVRTDPDLAPLLASAGVPDLAPFHAPGRVPVPAPSPALGRVPGAAITLVHNEDWPRGRTGSIQRGLAALPAGASGVLIHQVDFPFVRAATLRSLIDRFLSDPLAEERILVPVFQGRRGHPILIGRGILSEIRALGADEPLHLLLRKDPSRVIEVAVPDAGILRNMNRPPDRETEGT